MASSKPSGTTGRVLVNFEPIPDVKNDERVQELGMFAVAESEEAAVVFVEVVEAQMQVVAGANYSMLIKALDEGLNVRFYKALVYDRPWEDLHTLRSFASVLP
ncbi:hypothetical protein EJ110_NYTH21144 [Nymphaea thermarum]|nr:hypothetical protein EJ110_NYTH21144 [Nymphaea thermarum]